MVIDILFLVILIYSLIKGYQKGFIVALFSILGWIVGLAAALKLSTTVAAWLGTTTSIETRWLPPLAFILVFLATVILIRIGAKMIEGIIEFAFLGWANKALGILLYIALHTVIFSILLFFGIQLQFLSQSVINESITYKWIEPWGPGLMNALGSVIPFFRDMFQQLKDFFQQLQQKPIT